MYQELIDKCRQAYKDNNMVSAYHYWEQIYDLLDNKLEECKEDGEQRQKVYAEYYNSINQIPNQEVYDITDYGKKIAYEQMFKEQFKNIDLQKLSGGEDLELLKEFCDFYEWQPVDTGSGFNILDLQLNKLVEDEDYKTFSELVNRIVGRAIDYFRDEHEWQNDEDELNYGYGLYNIAVRHKDGTKWEEDWLADFHNELESLKKDLKIA